MTFDFKYDDIDEDPPHEADKDTGNNAKPIIKLKKSEEEERIFITCLAKLHNTDVANIDFHIDGYWKIYTINGVQIFKDHA